MRRSRDEIPHHRVCVDWPSSSRTASCSAQFDAGPKSRQWCTLKKLYNSGDVPCRAGRSYVILLNVARAVVADLSSCKNAVTRYSIYKKNRGIVCDPRLDRLDWRVAVRVCPGQTGHGFLWESRLGNADVRQPSGWARW